MAAARICSSRRARGIPSSRRPGARSRAGWRTTNLLPCSCLGMYAVNYPEVNYRKVIRSWRTVPPHPPLADSSPARSWWGWGALDQALSDAECASLAALVPGAAGTPLPVRSIASLDLPRVPGGRARSPRPPPVLRPGRPRVPHLRQGLPGRGPRAVRRYGGRSGPGGLPQGRAGRGGPPRLGRRGRRRGPVRGGQSWSAGSSTAPGSTPVSSRWTCRGWTGSWRPTGSAAPRIQAGALGPGLESQLRPHGLTLRHFPQSFALILGGLARHPAGGHYGYLSTRTSTTWSNPCASSRPRG
ncbi:hypothetical protein SMICM304S_11455 [Streptomyces microflavus]